MSHTPRHAATRFLCENPKMVCKDDAPLPVATRNSKPPALGRAATAPMPTAHLKMAAFVWPGPRAPSTRLKESTWKGDGRPFNRESSNCPGWTVRVSSADSLACDPGLNFPA